MQCIPNFYIDYLNDNIGSPCFTDSAKPQK